MTGFTTPLQAERDPRRAAATRRRAEPIKGLEAILHQRWRGDATADPRLTRAAGASANPPASLAARLKVMAPVEEGLSTFLDRLEEALRERDNDSAEAVEDGDLDPDTPLGLAPVRAPQACMQALVQDFSRRQKQATMLVTACVLTSCVLTVGGLAAFAGMAGRAPGASENPARSPSSSLAWRSPAPSSAPILAAASPNRGGKEDALLRHAVDASEPAAAQRPHVTAPELILMQRERPLLLAPLIEPRQARYILIRGLPAEAKLSAGQKNPSGAWLVKDEDIPALTLSIGGNASGDYAAEIYTLGGGALPQGRQRLVFRVEQALGRVASSDTNWASTLRDMASAMETAPEPAAGAYARASLAEGAGTPERLKILAGLTD